MEKEHKGTSSGEGDPKSSRLSTWRSGRARQDKLLNLTKDDILDTMLCYFWARGYFLAIQIDVENGLDYPYIGLNGSEESNFVVIRKHINSVEDMRNAGEEYFIEFMSHMTDLLSTRADTD